MTLFSETTFADQKTQYSTTKPRKIRDKSVFNMLYKTHKITRAVHKRINIIKIN